MCNGGHGGRHEPRNGSKQQMADSSVVDFSRSPRFCEAKMRGPLCGTLLGPGCRCPKKSSCPTQSTYATVCNAAACSSRSEQGDQVSTTVALTAHGSRRRMETPDQRMTSHCSPAPRRMEVSPDVANDALSQTGPRRRGGRHWRAGARRFRRPGHYDAQTEHADISTVGAKS